MTLFDPQRPVAVVGAGVMGAKVAFACVRAGLVTRLWDADPAQAPQAAARIGQWLDGGDSRFLQLAPTLEAAVDGVQLAFENVPERLDLKREVAAAIGRALPAEAFQGSNASTFTCTPIAAASGRPARFFNMNFNDPRSARLVELMTSPDAASETIAFAEAWARHVGMVPVRLLRENFGYSHNRLWRAIKKEVLRQIDQGIADADSIDRAWMLNWGTPQGPCGLMDEIGLHSVLRVEEQYLAESGDPADRPPAVLVDMVARGETGLLAGRGFYAYPDPAYRRPGWLEG